MESLSVLEVFCTNSHCFSTPRTNFKIWSIFMIFGIFNCGFGHFDPRNFYLSGNIRTIGYVFRNFYQKSLPEKKCRHLNSFLDNLAYFYWFFTFLVKSTISIFSFVGQRRIFYGVRNFYHPKVWGLSFQTHHQPYS